MVQNNVRFQHSQRTVPMSLCLAKSFILWVYSVLARHRGTRNINPNP